MFSRTSLAATTATLALFSLGFAKDETATITLDLIQWMGSDGEMVGSVVTAAPSATTYHVNCIPPEVLEPGDEEEDFSCGTITIIQGSKTHGMHVTWEPDFTWDLSCELSGKTRAECSGVRTSFDMYAGETGAVMTVTEDHTLTGDNVPWVPMRITGGVEKLDAVPTAAGGGGVTAELTPTTEPGTAVETETETPGTNAAGLIRPGWAIGSGVVVTALVSAL